MTDDSGFAGQGGGVRSSAASGAARGSNPSGGEVSDENVHAQSASSRLFDLRWLIAAMFVVYGIVLIITGAFDNQAEIKKAAGVRINLWTGIGMLVIGLVFLAWARLKPLRREDLVDAPPAEGTQP